MGGTTVVLFLALCIIGTFAAPKLNGRIVGGKVVQINDYSYQVSLQWKGKHFCGGSIINNKWILTAAHCINGISDFYNLKVITGTNLWKYGIAYSVEEAILHPKFNAKHAKNDIGLIRVSETIEFDKYTSPVGLPTSSKSSGIPGTSAVVSGWGVLKEDSKSSSAYLRCLTTHVTAFQGCGLKNTKLCTLSDTGKGACFGDSGGPLVSKNVQIGVASYVIDGCAVGSPDVFTRVWFYVDWIKKTIEKYEC